MDTVEPGTGIKPVFDGEDIIRSDGTTILGADNKAGCAVILEVIQSLLEDERGSPADRGGHQPWRRDRAGRRDAYGLQPYHREGRDCHR